MKRLQLSATMAAIMLLNQVCCSDMLLQKPQRKERERCSKQTRLHGDGGGHAQCTDMSLTNDLEFQCESLQDKRACNMTLALSRLLDGYDKRFRPHEEDNIPVNVSIGIRIFNLDKMNEVNMDYRLDLYLAQRWRDPRLANMHNEDLYIPNSMVNKIWIPDTYFLNSKHARYHKVTVPNHLLVLKPDGSLVHSSRITSRSLCSMDFHMFPADTQECHLHIESFGYTAKEVVYHWGTSRRWNESLPEQVRRHMHQFHIADFRFTDNLADYPLGTWSQLTATFIIQRHIGYFFLHFYAPCAMVVSLSWVSFFIPKEGIGARIRLAIIATLNITSILNLLNKVLPQVSYIKLVDWYLIISFVFVFGVFVEYTTVLWLTEKERKRMEHKKMIKEKIDEMMSLLEAHALSSDVVVVGNERNKASMKKVTFAKTQQSSPLPSPSCTHRPSEQHDELCAPIKPECVDDEDKESQSVADTHEVYFFCYFQVERIDDVSKILFPVAYLVFNVFYWLYFFNNKHHVEGGDHH